MAGIVEVTELFNQKLRYARVLGFGRFIDSNQKFNYYVLQILNEYGEVDFIRTQLTYKGGDVQVEGHIKQGDTLKLEILDEYSARYIKIDKFKVEIDVPKSYEVEFFDESLNFISRTITNNLENIEKIAKEKNLTFVIY